MVMSSLRNGASGGIGKFVLFGILALAAGGLVFSDVGGFFRGGVNGSDIARVADKTIPIQSFDRTVRRTISRLGISLEQAYELGYVREILNSEVRGHLMLEAAEGYNVKISKKHVAEQIQTLITPMMQDRQTPDETLKQLLVAQGMTEKKLVTDMKKDISLGLLQTALQAGFTRSSEALLSDIGAHNSETRSIGYVLFPDSAFEVKAAPSEEDLWALYAVTQEAYAIPELRLGQLMVIKADTLEKTLDIAPESVRAAYDDDIEAYQRPASRSVEQVILRTPEDAQAVFEKVKAGGSLKESTKAVTGSITDYIPPKPVTEENILEDLKEPVFSAEKNQAIGPVKTALGHHVLVLSSITAAYTEPFEKVKDDLLKELTALHLSDAKQDMANMLDDLLASGATPEDIQSELELKITELPAVTRYGQDSAGKIALQGMEVEQAQILETLFELADGESSAVFETKDGAMAALFLKSVTDKSYKPFDMVQDSLKSRWIKDQRRVNNKKAVLDLFASLQDKDISLSTLAGQEGKKLVLLKGIPRAEAGSPPAPLNAISVSAVFETPLKGLVILDLKDGAAIARVTDYKTPSLKGDKLAELKTNLLKNTQNEGISLFIDLQNKKYPAMINDRLLKQVYGTPQ